MPLHGDFGQYYDCLRGCFLTSFGIEQDQLDDNLHLQAVLKDVREACGALIVQAVSELLPLGNPYCTNPLMNQTVRELNRLGDLVAEGAAVPQIAPDEVEALLENLRLAVTVTWASGNQNSIRRQANLGRWWFLDQLPFNAKAAFRKGLEMASVPMPNCCR